MTDYEIVTDKLKELKIPYTMYRYRPDTLNQFYVTLTGTRSYGYIRHGILIHSAELMEKELLVFSRYGVLYTQSSFFSMHLWR